MNKPAISKHHLILGLYAVGLMGLVGLLFAIFVAVDTILDKNLHEHTLCFTNDCIQFFINEISYALLIAKTTFDLMIGVATIGGIVIALLSYVSSINNAAITNHIAHYTVFQSYVIAEIAKRDRIGQKSIDIFYWYNLIFPNSRAGQLGIADEYHKTVRQLADTINASNEKAKYANGGSYRFKEHQASMIRALRQFGIELTTQPRNDFYEIEDQVISLVETINDSFCHQKNLALGTKRAYV